MTEWINNKLLYSIMCAVIFLSKATRLVNARNLSMSAARGETFLQGANASPLAFYTSTQPLLGLKKKMCAVVLPPPVTKVSVHLWSVSHSVISRLPEGCRPTLVWCFCVSATSL